MKTYVSHFQLLMAAKRGHTVARLGPDDYAIYMHGVRNSFGTPLAARGTETEMLELLRTLGSSRL
jgi:hypothetical protein